MKQVHPITTGSHVHEGVEECAISTRSDQAQRPRPSGRGNGVHFIGICGTAMAPVAVMMKEQGWRVTGSDKGIFPPMSDYLRASGVEFSVGFHPEKIGNPDMVVVGNYIGPSNPEFISVKERNLPYRSYPEVLSEFLIKPQSIVVAGTYGKTTNTALLAWIWEQAGLRPSFMSAGILKNFSDGTRNSDGSWSIVEGDEYPSSRWDLRPKFMHYHPKYLLLTGAAHDHLDVYPTETDFVSAFEKLAEAIPHDGMVVAAADRPNVEKILKRTNASVVRYGRAPKKHDWSLEIKERKEGKTTLVIHGPNETIGPCTVSLLGDESFDHIAGVVALARFAGISPETIINALESFQGVRRRLEVRGIAGGITVIDDFGHSPEKAGAALNAVRLSYPDAHIIAVFEPNVGSRVASARELYDRAFDNANTVLIPRLSATKTGEGAEARMDGNELAEAIRARGHRDARYLPSDDELLAVIKNAAHPGDVVIFLGSHGFRGMIEQSLATLAT